MESRKRWLLVYGKYEGFEQKAVEFLCEDFSARVSYTLPVRRYDEVSDQDKERYNFLIVGTLDSNPKANELAKQNGWVLPDDCQGYRFDVTEEKDGVQTMSVIGSSEIGVMYGAVDFINTYLSTCIVSVKKAVRAFWKRRASSRQEIP